jgi:uncharacterized membrane protein
MFEWLFKYPPALFRQGELVLEPVVAWLAEPWLVAAVAVTVVAAGLLIGRGSRLTTSRRGVLAVLQTVFALGVLAVLARPALEVESLTPGANSVAVLMDGSGSMGFPADAAAQSTSRLQAARAAAAERLLPDLAPLAEVAVFGFGAGVTRQPLEAVTYGAPRTRLVGAVDDVLASFRDRPLAGVIVFSDGGDNAGGFDVEALREAGVPVHTVGVGPVEMTGEVELADVAMPAEAPPDSRVAADVTLRHSAAGPATLKVRDGGRLIAARDVLLDPATPRQRVPLNFASGPGGIRELSIEVVPPDGDTLAQNNRIARLLTVTERRRRVLYLEGEPRWEYKFIRRAVEGDDVLALTSWLRTTNRKTYRQNIDAPEELADGFPASLASLYGYDVIILGSLAATDFDTEQQRRLEGFVAERGGSLLALAGRHALADGGWDATPLADALPVALERRPEGTYVAEGGAVRPTLLGATSAMLELGGGEGGDPFASLPALADHQRLGPMKPAASALLEVLTSGGPRPLLVTQPYGLGTAAVLATATTWRWQMRTPADDRRHALFWRQLLRQLAETAQQPRALTLDVADADLTIRLVERNEEFAPRSAVRASARVTGPGADGSPVALSPTGAPGALEGRFRAPAAGVYRLDVSVGDDDPLTRFVRLGGEDAEYFHPGRNTALLQRLATTTGGRYWELADVGAIAQTLRLAGAGITQRERYPLWDMPAVFLLLLLVKVGEWLLRRRWGRI